MSDDAPASSSSAVSGGDLITSLNPNDVILGRGAGASQFIGNLRFRSRVESRQEEYFSIKTHKHKTKARISRELVDQTHAMGGRFLKPVDEWSPEEVWYEVADSVAIEKCKQTIRDSWRKEGPSDGNDNGNNGEKGVREGKGNELLERDVGSVGVMSSPVAFSLRSTFALLQQPTAAQPMAMNPVLPLQFNCSVQNQSGTRIVPDTYLPRDSMLQGLSQDQYVSGSTSDAVAARKRHLANSTLSSHLQDAMPWQVVSVSAEPNSGHTGTAAHTSTSKAVVSAAAASDDDLLAYLISLLISDRPMITEEQVDNERAKMTDDERVEFLVDLFGKQCDISTSRNKKANRDLDKNSIDFLIKMMKLELERIPNDRKGALLEAQIRCRADEFSDSRLERFLRCEGRNPKLGAQRFVNYWEYRRKVFGPDKFVQRMSLSEALCDDLAAVEACIYCPLPHLDTSGRQLLLVEPSRHTREGYTSESMLRAVWYVFEVMAQEKMGMESGLVILAYLQDFTIWDFDHGLYDQIISIERNCWPVKIAARHCYLPSVFVKIMKYMLNALMDKRGRSRMLMHDVATESELLDVLSSYGIEKYMLPTEMGGTVLLNQAEWIASRRASELEDI